MWVCLLWRVWFVVIVFAYTFWWFGVFYCCCLPGWVWLIVDVLDLLVFDCGFRAFGLFMLFCLLVVYVVSMVASGLFKLYLLVFLRGGLVLIGWILCVLGCYVCLVLCWLLCLLEFGCLLLVGVLLVLIVLGGLVVLSFVLLIVIDCFWLVVAGWLGSDASAFDCYGFGLLI